MTNKQKDLLCFIYPDPKTVTEIYQKFALDYDSFIDLTVSDDFQRCSNFERAENYEQSTLSLTKSGIEIVELLQAAKDEKLTDRIRYWITTAIAVAAFVKSFFF